jgi:integrase
MLDKPVFHGQGGCYLRCGNFLRSVFRPLVKRAGVRPVTLHDLRHAHASHLLEAGVPVKVVSERLGHASVSITLSVYQSIMPGMQEAAADQAETIYGPPHRVHGRVQTGPDSAENAAVS